MLPDKAMIDEFKEIYRKKHGKELSDAEASEAAYGLVGLVDILMKSAEKEVQRNRQLKQNPNGFHLADGTYSCSVCGRTITGDESWYDKWGIKCMLCQKAVDGGIIPGFICKERDSYYHVWQLQNDFKIHPATTRKLVRQGKLNARIIPGLDGKPYEYIFLKSENPELINRYSPTRKSYDRHREKESNKSAKEWKAEWKKEIKKKHEKKKA